MENNTLPQKITETINDIITELDAFKKNTSTPEYTLTGSVALYLFVYSLYANNEGATKAFVRKQLLSFGFLDACSSLPVSFQGSDGTRPHLAQGYPRGIPCSAGPNKRRLLLGPHRPR